MVDWAPPPFTLRQLQYALAVDAERGFRRAAQRCHVAQPSLSAQLAQLEEALGVVLFERNRSGVLRTPGADEVLARARTILAAVADLEATARRLADPMVGTLRVGVIPTLAPYLLPRLGAPVRTAYPGLQLLWREDKTAVLAEALHGGELDAALVALEGDLGDVEHRRVALDRFVLACAPEHPLARRTTALRDLAAIGEHPVYLLDEGHCFRDQALDLCARVGVREADFRATSLTTLVQVVASQGGLTFLPALAVDVENRSRTLVIREFRRPPTRTLALVWRPRSPLGPALRTLAEAFAVAVA